MAAGGAVQTCAPARKPTPGLTSPRRSMSAGSAGMVTPSTSGEKGSAPVCEVMARAATRCMQALTPPLVGLAVRLALRLAVRLVPLGLQPAALAAAAPVASPAWSVRAERPPLSLMMPESRPGQG